jgi:hypothetical protein
MAKQWLNEILDDAAIKMALIPDELVSPETRAYRAEMEPWKWINLQIVAIDMEMAKFRERRRTLIKQRRKMKRRAKE